jgi:Flp pilus assembly pilin Flp
MERISLKLGQLLRGLKREEGQGATEYAMVIGFVILGLALTLGTLGGSIQGFLEDVGGALDGLGALLP